MDLGLRTWDPCEPALRASVVGFSVAKVLEFGTLNLGGTGVVCEMATILEGLGCGMYLPPN